MVLVVHPPCPLLAQGAQGDGGSEAKKSCGETLQAASGHTGAFWRCWHLLGRAQGKDLHLHGDVGVHRPFSHSASSVWAGRASWWDVARPRGDNCSVLGFPPGVSGGGGPWGQGLSEHKSSRWRHHPQEQSSCVCPAAPSPSLTFLISDYIHLKRSGK